MRNNFLCLTLRSIVWIKSDLKKLQNRKSFSVKLECNICSPFGGEVPYILIFKLYGKCGAKRYGF